MRESQLHRLARAYGIQTSYVDMENRTVGASADSVLAVLGALGAPVENARDFANALRLKQRGVWDWWIEPVFAAWEGRLPEVSLRLPAAQARGQIEIELCLEDGERRSRQSWMETLPGLETRELDGESYVALRLPVGGKVPSGYHTLVCTAGHRRFESLIVAAPKRAYSPPTSRSWGAFLPLYAVHSKRSWGAGDLTDLRGLVGWAAREGASFVGTLPLLASFLDEPFAPSPYAPVSRLFWNELFIDLDATYSEATGGAGHSLSVPSDISNAVAWLREQEFVPYREAMALKRRVLEGRAGSACRDAVAQQSIDAFLAENPRVRDYASFRAVVEKLGADWRRWPEQPRRGDLSATDYDMEVAGYHAFCQWQIASQMRSLAAESKGRGVELYLDLPVGVHPDGYDAWRFQDLFVEGANVGAPPDVVTTSGQDWGFRPLHPDSIRRSRYEYVRAYLDHHLSVAGLLRIDHAMGIRRLYWIPAGASAHDGVYVGYNPEEMYAVLSLESHRHQAGIVGEDLGIVPNEVRRGMREHAIAGAYVLSIELRSADNQPFRPVPRHVVASFGTHDLPTFAAFWSGADIDERQRLGVLDPERAARETIERAAQKAALLVYLRRQGLLTTDSDDTSEVLKACLALLAWSPSERVLVNLEDLWLEERAQNVPGTSAGQHPNWRRRARYSLEELQRLPAVQELLAAVQRLRPSDHEVSKGDSR